MRGLWDSWFARSQWRDERAAKNLQVPGWLAAAALLLAFGGGYLVGGKVKAGAGDGGASLQAKKGTSPEFLDTCDGQPLTRTGFLVAHYLGAEETDAKARAMALTRYLKDKGLKSTKPYLASGANGPLWTVAVWFDGETEQRALRDRLLALVPEDVPDASFQFLRKDGKEEWPKARTFR